MSTIPSWARPGVLMVLIDDSAGITSLHHARAGDICVLDRVFMVGDIAACVCHQKDGAWRVADGYAAKISRFRPLVDRPQEQDIAEHFSHHLRQPVRETERAE